MLNDYGKSLFKPWMSVPNVLIVLAAVFIVSLLNLTSVELASWVQAIGSIVAIIGAFMIGNIQHQRAVEQKKIDVERDKQAVKNFLFSLSQDVDVHLGFLISAIDGTFAAYGVSGIDRYVLEGYDLRWTSQAESLRAVDVKTLDGNQRLFLVDIKTACDFAIRTCKRLGSWDSSGNEESIITAQMMFHKSRTEIAYKLLGMTSGVIQRDKPSTDT